MSDRSGRTRARHLAAAVATALTASMGITPASVTAADVDRAVREVERYCVASWKAAGIPQQEWDDCTQEALLRLLERLASEGARDGGDAHRELQRVIWSTAKAWQRSAGKAATCGSAEPSGQIRTEEQVVVKDLLEHGISQLSELQRTVITRWANGYSVNEIAEQLGIPPARVSDAKYKAIQNLRKFLSKRS